MAPDPVTLAMQERALLGGIARYTKLQPKNKASMALVDGQVIITKLMWDEETDTFIPTPILSMSVAEMTAVRKYIKDNMKTVDDFLILAQALT